MTRKLLIAPLLALGLTAAPAPAHSPTSVARAQAEVSIPFANHGGIRDWRSDGDRTIYLQDSGRHWYKATLMTRAIDLPFTEAIGFDTGPIDRFDHFSSIVVRGQRYAVQSLVPVAGPPAPRSEHHARA
jgi:hypothetical protein